MKKVPRFIKNLKKIKNFLQYNLTDIAIGCISVASLLFIILDKWISILLKDKNNEKFFLILAIVTITVVISEILFIIVVANYSRKKGLVTYVFSLSAFASVTLFLMMLVSIPTNLSIIGFTIASFFFGFTFSKIAVPAARNFKAEYLNETSAKDKMPIIINLIIFLLGVLIGR
ncbi:hypothetical protein [Enterococcus sp. AZ103]|uniref:hypothetical protein n=1 Tax=Enterococcus sp. AZ103 TaxID=2774628 RepID=UPI003F29C1FF